MPLVTKKIESYTPFVYAGDEGSQGARAAIYLQMDEARAYLRFYEEGTALPANKASTHISGDALYHVSYPASRLDTVIDLLRNEGPVYFRYRVEDDFSFLNTSSEPVGEGELS